MFTQHRWNIHVWNNTWSNTLLLHCPARETSGEACVRQDKIMNLGWYLWNSKHADESTGTGVHAKTYTHAAWSTPAAGAPPNPALGWGCQGSLLMSTTGAVPHSTPEGKNAAAPKVSSSSGWKGQQTTHERCGLQNIQVLWRTRSSHSGGRRCCLSLLPACMTTDCFDPCTL